MKRDYSKDQEKLTSGHCIYLSCCHWRLLLIICGAMLFGSHMSFAAAVVARVAAVKGDVRGSSNEPLQVGSSLRAGAVISTAAGAGVLIRPSPLVSVVAATSTKLRFDGAELDNQGRGNVNFTLLSGSMLVRIDESSADAPALSNISGKAVQPVFAPAPSNISGKTVQPVFRPKDGTSGNSQPDGKVKVSVRTELGVITATSGTWSVRSDEKRTVVAVEAGRTDVTIGGGSAGGQVEVPKGSVIWLERSALSTVLTRVVDTQAGTMVVIQPDGTRDTSQKPSEALLAEASGFIQTTGDPTPTSVFTPIFGPNTPTTNPDLSSPVVVRPVVSSDTP